VLPDEFEKWVGLELPLASRTAAAWWRRNVPHLMKPWKFFMFHEHVCHVIDDR